MRAGWASTLGIVLGCWTTAAAAQDIEWRPARTAPVATTAADPDISLGAPVAALGTPQAHRSAPETAADPAALSDPQLLPAAWSLDAGTPYVVRAQAAEPPPPAPAPYSSIPPAAPAPVDPIFPTAPPPNGAPPPGTPGFWGNVQQNIHLEPGCFSCPQRSLFQSDNAFPEFISPVTNPFLFLDPRALTEVRPIIMQQGTPSKNPVFSGGNVQFFGTQASVAVTERLSFLIDKVGGVWTEPDGSFLNFDFGNRGGFAELWVAPQWTFLRCENTKTLAALGLIFEIPCGSGEVYQNTGDLSLTPYITFAQNFWRTSYGSMNFMANANYAFAVDNVRSETFNLNTHFDYDIANYHKFFPLFEINYFYYSQNGDRAPINFEGADLFNFGAMHVSGSSELDLGIGIRWQICHWAGLGTAIEWDVLHPQQLLDYRWTLDMIFRY